MGNTFAFHTFQHTIITLYNAGVLNRHLLDDLAEYYYKTDIDVAGWDKKFVGYDGMELDHICISTIYPDWIPEKEEEWEKKWSILLHERWEW